MPSSIVRRLEAREEGCQLTVVELQITRGRARLIVTGTILFATIFLTVAKLE
jgi:hypothetical protein